MISLSLQIGGEQVGIPPTPHGFVLAPVVRSEGRDCRLKYSDCFDLLRKVYFFTLHCPRAVKLSRSQYCYGGLERTEGCRLLQSSVNKAVSINNKGGVGSSCCRIAR